MVSSFMAPAASTIASSQTNLTSSTDANAAKAKSLQGYKEDCDFFGNLSKVCEEFTSNDHDVWLISVPEKFPESHLGNIPLVPNASVPIAITNDDAIGDVNTEKYICESKACHHLKSVIIPASSKGSTFRCKTIDKILHVRECVTTSSADFSNCLPRPPPPSMSRNLTERLKLFGWRIPGESTEASPSKSVVAAPNATDLPDGKKAKKRKIKKKDKNENMHDRKKMKHKKHKKGKL